MSPRISAALDGLVKTAAFKIPVGGSTALRRSIGSQATALPRAATRLPAHAIQGTPASAPPIRGGATKPQITWANPAAAAPPTGGVATIPGVEQTGGLDLAKILGEAQAAAGGVRRSIPWKGAAIAGVVPATYYGMKHLGNTFDNTVVDRR